MTELARLDFRGQAPKKGSVMSVTFDLAGQRYNALNGNRNFKFNNSISLLVSCEDQGEVDRFWEAPAERRPSAAGSRTVSACPGRLSPTV